MGKAQEFRDQSIDELNATLLDKRRERFNLLNQRQKEKKLDKPHLLKTVKKDIARILTVISEKESVKETKR